MCGQALEAWTLSVSDSMQEIELVNEGELLDNLLEYTPGPSC